MCHGSIVRHLLLSGAGKTELADLSCLYKSCSERFRKINSKTYAVEV